MKDINTNFQAIIIENDDVVIKDKDKLCSDIDLLAEKIILSDEEELVQYYFSVIRKLSWKLGIFPVSIYSLYKARSEGKVSGFTVPSVNFRTLTYESAQALFEVAKECEAAAFLLGIARSEIEYTRQSPFEYAALVLAAAIKTGYKGPVFFQADSLRINPIDYFRNPEGEIKKLEELIEQYVRAGFFNIDLDLSSLEDFADSSSELHLEAIAQLTSFIRKIQPPQVEIAIGARLKKEKGRNTTAEDLHAFMEKHRQRFSQNKGIIKLAIETGAVHGGVVMPDGSIAKVRIDFDTIKKLGEIGSKHYNLAGVVQHGASTLPPEAFSKFPEHDTLEVHLATQFQNIIYDNLPLGLKERIYNWLNENLRFEREPQQTNPQFIYKTRKKALGPFKKEIYMLPADIKKNIYRKLKEEFSFLFQQLHLHNTRQIVEKFVVPTKVEDKLSDIKEER